MSSLKRFNSNMYFLIISIISILSCSPEIDIGIEKQKIEALLDKNTIAFENRDWNSYESFWMQDSTIEVIHPDNNEWLVGWKNVKSKYKAIFDSQFSAKLLDTKRNIHVSDSAEMSWMTSRDIIQIIVGTDTSVVTQWSTAVFEKRYGEWRIVHAHASTPKINSNLEFRNP